MSLSTSRKDANKQKVLSFQEVSQKRKMAIKIEFTPLTLHTAKCFLLKRVLKNN